MLSLLLSQKAVWSQKCGEADVYEAVTFFTSVGPLPLILPTHASSSRQPWPGKLPGFMPNGTAQKWLCKASCAK